LSPASAEQRLLLMKRCVRPKSQGQLWGHYIATELANCRFIKDLI
jgi:hypothetical protein